MGRDGYAGTAAQTDRSELRRNQAEDFRHHPCANGEICAPQAEDEFADRQGYKHGNKTRQRNCEVGMDAEIDRD